jgi:hypothetical protein
MSEKQYHEWQTVDWVLTSEGQAAVNNLPAISRLAPTWK